MIYKAIISVVLAKSILDPGNPEAVSYLLALIEEIVTNYNLDGLHLDYIRYPFQNLGAKPIYGYGFESRVEFWEQTNVDPAALAVEDPLWQEWTGFRTEQITEFVGKASRMIKKLKPQLTISAAVFPYPRWERVARIQQDWEQWIEEGYIDWLVPMTYAENTAQLATMVEPLVEKQGKAHETLIVPAVQLKPGQGLSNLDQIEMIREFSFQGYALFAANGFSADLQQILSQTQGDQPLVLPHRQPLTAAAMKFATLGQEWSFYWGTKEAQALAPALKADWQQRSDRVEQQLKALAANPSMKNLIFTKIELQSLQEQFNQWPLPEELYQRSIWGHHLQEIAQLLAMYEQNLDRDYFR
ncbi:MAG: family 10 glycosylhydrolase [Synechococcaceae cyanobacterium RL_1_2]|nr:family 10 glycosylhydrolase [Synechococcaceae cyanobacterium RL_1_2]